jgi:hypothetical protein
LTDFVCLYTYEFWLSLCKIVRSSAILLLPLSDMYFVYTSNYIKLSSFLTINLLELMSSTRYYINKCNIWEILIILMLFGVYNFSSPMQDYQEKTQYRGWCNLINIVITRLQIQIKNVSQFLMFIYIHYTFLLQAVPLL